MPDLGIQQLGRRLSVSLTESFGLEAFQTQAEDEAAASVAAAEEEEEEPPLGLTVDALEHFIETAWPDWLVNPPPICDAAFPTDENQRLMLLAKLHWAGEKYAGMFT